MIDSKIRNAVEEYLLEMIEGKREKRHFSEIAKAFNEKFNTSVLNKNNVYLWNKQLLEKKGGSALPKEAREVEQVQVTEGERCAQVFSLFEMGKDPVAVTIELKLLPKQVMNDYNQYKEMKELGEKVEHFTVICSKCGQLVERKSTDRRWDELVKPALKNTFGSFYHEGCRERP